MATELLFKVGWSAFSLVFVAVGLFVVNGGRKRRARSERIDNTETTPVRDLGPGTVELKGTARPAAEATPRESPITAADALAFHVEVEKYQSSSQGGGSWRTIHEEQEAVPILLGDGTGEVRVELPADGGLDVELTRKRVGGGEEPPEPIRRYVENEAAVDEATRHDLGLLSIGERRRYSEGVIEPGEEVYVLGRAREKEAGWGDREYVIDEPTEAGDFVLSDKSEEDLIEEGKWGGVIMLVFGGVFVVVGSLFAVVPWIAM